MSRPLSSRRGLCNLQVETLEDRATPALTATLVGSTLAIRGTIWDDNIFVQQRGDTIEIAGITTTFNAKQVKRIEVRGGPGDDFIEMAGEFGTRKARMAIWLYGEEGDDTILGSEGADTIYGGDGNDAIDGRNGSDQIIGGDGDDALWGSGGSDRLTGGEGNDSLYGGEGSDYLVGNGGDDIFLGGEGRDTFKDDFDLTRPVVDGLSALDVQQGSGGTCAILATLAGAAEAGVDLGERITYLGGNSFRVQVYANWMWGLFHRPRYEIVTFDGTWYDHDAQPARQRDEWNSPTGAPTGDFWATLFQRAVLQQEGDNWRDPRSIEQWATSEAKAHSVILGDRNWHTIDANNKKLPSELRNALQAGEVVTAGTRSFGTDSNGEEIIEQNGIISLHAYAVLDVYQDGNQWRIMLYNPWGWDAQSDAVDGYDDGIIDIDWGTFAQQFEVYSRTLP